LHIGQVDQPDDDAANKLGRNHQRHNSNHDGNSLQS
jgi:hypothetical protein